MGRGGYGWLRMPKDGGSRGIFHAKVIDRGQINAAVRYVYVIVFGHWNMRTAAANGGTWVLDDDNDGAGYYAFNSTEDMNTDLGSPLSIGTGNTNVTRSDGTIASTSCKLLGIPIGAYVMVTPRGRGVQPDRTRYYTIINFENSSQT